MGKVATYKDENLLLEQIKSGDEQVLERLYDQYRKEFVLWLKKMSQTDEETAIEVYQKSFTIVFFNIKKGKLTELNSSLKTYLFGVGKHVFAKAMRDKTRNWERIEEVPEGEGLDTSIMERYNQAHQKELIGTLLTKIGEPCKTVLELFYLKQYSVEAIAVEMNYKNERVVSKRKSVCLDQIRKLIANG